MYIEKPDNNLVGKEDEQNVEMLKLWIELLISPFKGKDFAPNCYYLSSVLNPGTEDFLPNKMLDLVCFIFPTTASSLYLKIDPDDYIDEGYIVLSVDNSAYMSFKTTRHSILKYSDLYRASCGSKVETGTWEMVTKKYLQYVGALMAVPKYVEI